MLSHLKLAGKFPVGTKDLPPLEGQITNNQLSGVEEAVLLAAAIYADPLADFLVTNTNELADKLSHILASLRGLKLSKWDLEFMGRSDLAQLTQKNPNSDELWLRVVMELAVDLVGRNYLVGFKEQLARPHNVFFLTYPVLSGDALGTVSEEYWVSFIQAVVVRAWLARRNRSDYSHLGGDEAYGALSFVGTQTAMLHRHYERLAVSQDDLRPVTSFSMRHHWQQNIALAAKRYNEKIAEMNS